MIEFTKLFHYECDNCRFKVPVFLERGLEVGQAEIDGEVPFPDYMKDDGWYPPFPGRAPLTTLPTTGSRMALPVPFVGTACPICQPGHPPWDMTKGVLSHVGKDRVFVPPLVTLASLPHFRYPTDVELRNMGSKACGRFRWGSPA